MIKNIFFIVIILISSLTFGQKEQRIGYIDMNYILENVPEYVEAQNQLDDKVKNWQSKLDALSKEIEADKISLSNEEALLTSEMITERQEDIVIKENELRRLQNAYFGTKGDLYRMRQQFVQPVQDQVFNAVQQIAERKKYDMVLDKSSDLIMLYTNGKFDISELVLNAIVKNRKKAILEENKQARIKKVNDNDVIDEKVIDEVLEEAGDVEPTKTEDKDEAETETDTIEKTEAEKKAEERAAKRAELKERIKQQQEAREKLRDSLKKVAEERRAARLKEIEERNKQREQNINKDN